VPVRKAPVNVSLVVGEVPGLADDLADIFSEAYRGGRDAVVASRGMARAIGDARARAADYAHARAADAITDIDETTRGRVRDTIAFAEQNGWTDAQLRDKLKTAFAFDPERADMIARTEAATAWNLGVVASLKDAGEEYVYVSDGDEWDEECQNADGEVWTVEEAEANPLEHPNCQRDFRPLSNEELAEQQAEEEDDTANGFSANEAARIRFRVARFYSEDQARDDHGRWTNGGSTEGAKIENAHAAAFLHQRLVENPKLTLAQALKELRAAGHNISQERLKQVYEQVKAERAGGNPITPPPSTTHTAPPSSEKPSFPDFRGMDQTKWPKSSSETEKAIYALPKEHLDGLRTVFVTERLDRPNWVGSHNSQESLIRIRPRETAGLGWYSIKGTVDHEVGHHVHMTRMTDEAAAEWKQLSNDGRNARISAYARSNQSEHFAEAYRAYHAGGVDSSKLKHYEPRAHEFMTRLHGAGASTMLHPIGRNPEFNMRTYLNRRGRQA
jgi:hypothetical protein